MKNYPACKELTSPYIFQVTKVRPNDKDAKAKYTECNKIVTMNAFARAIAVDDNKSIADSLDFNTMGKFIIDPHKETFYA